MLREGKAGVALRQIISCCAVRAERRLLHWSNIVGASHSASYMIWQYGDYASRGVREVCEFGYPRSVQDEIEQNVSIVSAPRQNSRPCRHKFLWISDQVTRA